MKKRRTTNVTTRMIKASSVTPKMNTPATARKCTRKKGTDVTRLIFSSAARWYAAPRVRRDGPPVVPGPGADDPFFKDFFDQFLGRGGPGRREEFRQPGLGSGVIIDKRGYVLTNFHVIRGADSVTVKLPSKQEYQGRIIGTDAKTDLAIVRFQPEGDLRVAALGDSSAERAHR